MALLVDTIVPKTIRNLVVYLSSGLPLTLCTSISNSDLITKIIAKINANRLQNEQKRIELFRCKHQKLNSLL